MLIIIKLVCLGTSFVTLLLSLIFLLFPRLYFRIEEIVDAEILPTTEFFTALEGRINFINDWVFKNRVVFGVLFVSCSMYNIKSFLVL